MKLTVNKEVHIEHRPFTLYTIKDLKNTTSSYQTSDRKQKQHFMNITILIQMLMADVFEYK